MVTVRRGDVVIVDLNPTAGSEQRGKNRPCLVVQNDTGNEVSPTTIIAPFTTAYDDPYPFEVEVQASESPLREESVVDLSQLRVLNIDGRIQQVIGSLESSQMADVDRALRVSLGLTG
jgi:mRNA interferase MazF